MAIAQIVILALIEPQVRLREVFAERLGADYREVWCCRHSRASSGCWPGWRLN